MSRAGSRFFLNAELWSGLLAGLTNAAGFGKIMNERFTLLIKRWFLPLSF